MKKKWKIKSKLDAKEKDRLQKIIDILLANRGLENEQDRQQFFEPAHPTQTKLTDLGIKKQQVSKALKRLKQAYEKKEKVIVYGDYDADGITSTAIMWETLYELGFDVLPFLPHREKQGYGLKPKGIKDAIAELGKPAVILTVDNGIVAFEGAKFCKKEGIDLIICDHHEAHSKKPSNRLTNEPNDRRTKELKNLRTEEQKNKKKEKIENEKIESKEEKIKRQIEKLPDALAVIHSSKTSGAGLAYLLAMEVVSFLRRGDSQSRPQEDGSQTRPQLGGSQTHPYEHLLELAAIGVIADVVPLQQLSRSIAKYGLEQLPQSQRPGLQSLYAEADLDITQSFSPHHVGFVIAPRLNATGRLDHCLDSLRLLCTKDETRAQKLAIDLGSINRERQDMTRDSLDSALYSIKDADKKKILIVDSEEYHPGVIGLIAGKLTEQYYRPSIAIAVMGDEGKGSVRSVPGVNIIEFLRSHRNEFIEVGGHPLAAGFSVAADNIDNLRKQLEEYAEEVIADELLVPNLNIDTDIELTDVSMELYEYLRQFEPFGMGNPRPVFVSHCVEVVDVRTVGKEGKHLKLRLCQEPGTRSQDSFFDGIYFNAGDWVGKLKVGDVVDIAYQIDLNEWNGRTSLQLFVKDLRRAK